ncbi:hypothetical protein [Legionella shakespearei]|uniref:Uncharacterized protein n=1 Tax=Legionella shakespearei DSM 23087 TaxID=1122169 RepID=A0A0W0YLA1_9GAMM|nr:hypothetical protein [Legionella shakespearei]KTD57653.1 hypothetical protein Lsha_2494 [Legionella shakespearei DSM 23087]
MNKFTVILGFLIVQLSFASGISRTENATKTVTPARVEAQQSISSINVSNTITLNALATIITKGIDVDGSSADPGYWMRAHTDFIHAAWRISGALVTLASKMDEGPDRVILEHLAARLADLEIKDEKGNVHFWERKAKKTANVIKEVASQIKRISEHIKGQVDITTFFQATAQIATEKKDRGKGNVSYWRRATRDRADLGKATAKGITVMLDSIPADFRYLFETYTIQLANMSSKGDGNVSYWHERAEQLRRELNQVSQALVDLSLSL